MIKNIFVDIKKLLGTRSLLSPEEIINLGMLDEYCNTQGISITKNETDVEKLFFNYKKNIDKIKKFNWKKLLKSDEVFDGWFLDRYFKYIRSYIDIILAKQKLPEDFIKKLIYNYQYSVYDILQYQRVSENILEELINKYNINRTYIVETQDLSEEFIEKYLLNENCWNSICKYQILSESFLEKYISNFSWTTICRYQVLSINFINRYRDKVNWNCIYKYQSHIKIDIHL